MPPISLRRVQRIAEFREALREFESHSADAVRAAGLTPQRYLLLLFIKSAHDGSERASFTELKDRLRLSANTVTELVGRCEEAGLVRRESAEHDQRVVYLSLSREGERRLLAAIAETDDMRRQLTNAFASLVSGFETANRR